MGRQKDKKKGETRGDIVNHGRSSHTESVRGKEIESRDNRETQRVTQKNTLKERERERERDSTKERQRHEY